MRDYRGEIHSVRWMFHGDCRIFQEILARIFRPATPWWIANSGQQTKRRCELGWPRADWQISLIYPTEFVRISMNMDQTLRDARRLGYGVAACGNVAQARAHRDEKVRRANPIGKVQGKPETKMACVAGMIVVDEILAAKRGHHRQLINLDKRLYGCATFV